MSELAEGTEYTTMGEMIDSGDYILVEFRLVCKTTPKFEFLGFIDPSTEDHVEVDQNLYPILIGDIVTLTQGKFPLESYKDTLFMGRHKYIFEKDNGIILKGFLNGFTWHCKDLNVEGFGCRVISVWLKKNK
jgi:hypothetical protein